MFLKRLKSPIWALVTDNSLKRRYFFLPDLFICQQLKKQQTWEVNFLHRINLMMGMEGISRDFSMTSLKQRKTAVSNDIFHLFQFLTIFQHISPPNPRAKHVHKLNLGTHADINIRPLNHFCGCGAPENMVFKIFLSK